MSGENVLLLARALGDAMLDDAPDEARLLLQRLVLARKAELAAAGARAPVTPPAPVYDKARHQAWLARYRPQRSGRAPTRCRDPEGRVFGSATEAAAAYGVTQGAVTNWLARGHCWTRASLLKATETTPMAQERALP